MDHKDKFICRYQIHSGEQKPFFPTNIRTPVLLREHFLAKDFTFHFVSLHFFFIKESSVLKTDFELHAVIGTRKIMLGVDVVQSIGKSTKNNFLEYFRYF